MQYEFIRDGTKVEKILDLIISDPKGYQITRVDKNGIRIYYQISDNQKIYMDIFYPSDYQNQIESTKTGKEKTK